MSRATFFIILLFGAALLLAFWPGKDKDGGRAVPTVEDLQPDGIAQDLVVSQYDDQGRLANRVKATTMVHYGQLEETFLEEPEYELFDEGATSPWRIQARKGKVSQNRLVTLEDDVIISSQDPNQQIQRIETGLLQMDLDAKTLSSDDWVTISGPRFVMRGKGMTAELNGQKVRLLDQVTATYE
ncbi:LPS export ABC transporter periplasmic protein LptC [Gallaecimonas sp. GXIMD4217]|uniref:LPS export ABC transporter periplasmic protein LptC n=1 Tax=Gallaecimonas sp. GXIMD4217 TaxID=3131927 RepID=UPI00311B0F49